MGLERMLLCQKLQRTTSKAWYGNALIHNKMRNHSQTHSFAWPVLALRRNPWAKSAWPLLAPRKSLRDKSYFVWVKGLLEFCFDQVPPNALFKHGRGVQRETRDGQGKGPRAYFVGLLVTFPFTVCFCSLSQPRPSVDAFRPPAKRPSMRTFLALAFSSLGIIYGDIGTSPLYVHARCVERFLFCTSFAHYLP